MAVNFDLTIESPAAASIKVSRVAAWDWYDGPTEGLLQCEDSITTFYFRMLEERIADNDGDDVRIYGLYPSELELFNQFVAEVGAHHPPRWPVWWPIWRFPNEEIAAADDRLMQSVIEDAGKLQWIVATSDAFQSVRTFPVVG